MQQPMELLNCFSPVPDLSIPHTGFPQMKRTALFFLIVLLLSPAGCSRQNRENGEIVAEINDYSLSRAEFDRKLAAEIEMEEDYKLTSQAKLDFLDELIGKEILIQEAKKRELDQQQEFVRAMEKYWESTLIRNLLALKGKEIAAAIQVSEEEIKARYHELQQSAGQVAPLQDIRSQLAEEIREEKKTEMLKDWLSTLRKKSKIRIYKERL